VDYEPRLAPFYRAAGFRDGAAGVLELDRPQPPAADVMLDAFTTRS
jgi:hypothetical protein